MERTKILFKAHQTFIHNKIQNNRLIIQIITYSKHQLLNYQFLTQINLINQIKITHVKNCLRTRLSNHLTKIKANFKLGELWIFNNFRKIIKD